ncbi:MAG: hypothetical protein AM326_10095 [Candidatus Thorarchaeota archaeon SMTZ-45]|nr:MAG: hypothetical protein AM325_14700 [Candidatus Thorarchaeota archaeon SMTZ1-45]KXH74117.1 MAG: hypothetical protein AM326_10095 [Candidatus Thorarchaeota archaeon SMTZ-45]
MAELNLHERTAQIGWLVVGWLLTLVVVVLWFMTDTITTVVFVVGIGLGLGIAFIIVMNEALILTTIQTLQRAGESTVQLLSLRKNMRAVLAVWIFGLFTLVVVMTVFNFIELEKFTAIMGVLGSFVASVVAYYFATGKSSTPS